MKTVILNASPRKSWNTGMLLKSAAQGAQDAGAEVEYVDLYELTFTGCHSCLVCKLKNSQRCHCFWKDDLSPLLDRIFESDALIMGSPIYFGDTTSQFHAVAERLRFVALSYDDRSSYFEGSINTGFIFTMNTSPKFFKAYNEDAILNQCEPIAECLHGTMSLLPAYNTLQVKDYSKYSMGMFNPEDKAASRETQFPVDLQAAYQMGFDLSTPRE